MARDRRADIEMITSKLRSLSPDTGFGKTLPYIYALSQGRADEARTALAKLRAARPEWVKQHEIALSWALRKPGVDPTCGRCAAWCVFRRVLSNPARGCASLRRLCRSHGRSGEAVLLFATIDQQAGRPRDVARSARQGKARRIRLRRLLARERLARHLPAAERD